MQTPATHNIALSQRGGLPPYSLSVRGAAEHFGFAPHTIHQWINDGKLIQGKHYLKVGRKTVIIRHAFIEYMEDRNRVSKKAG